MDSSSSSSHAHADGDGVVVQYTSTDGGHYISIYSLLRSCFTESYLLPIYEESSTIVGSRCGGLYCYTNYVNHFFLCDLTSYQFKPLLLPNVEPPPSIAVYHMCGIGQNPNTGDYKVVIAYKQYFNEIDRYGRDVLLGYKNRAILYSHINDSWRKIECPDTFTSSLESVYIESKRYWTAMTSTPEDQYESFFLNFQVVSFDFRTESFDLFPLPPYLSQNYKYNLLEYGDMLGAAGYDRSFHCEYKVLVRRDEKWIKLHNVVFDCAGLGRPLAFRDKRFLFMEASRPDNDQESRILAFDVVLGGCLIGAIDINAKKDKVQLLGHYVKQCPYQLDGERLRYAHPPSLSLSGHEDEEVEEKMVKKNKKKKNKKKSAKKD